MTAHQVGPVEAFPEGVPVVFCVVATQTRLVVCRNAGSLHALRDQCSHQGRSMAGGSVYEGELRCPHHGVRYALTTGEIAWDAGFLGLLPCETVPVWEQAGRVHVDV